MTRITVEQAVSTVERVLAEYGPDHVAERVYGTAEKPVCLIGHILAEHAPEAFKQLRPKYMSWEEQPRVWWLLHRSFVAVSTPLLVALGNAQSDQDKQEPWGVAARHILDLKERV